MKTINLTTTEQLSGIKSCKDFTLQDYKKMWWKELGTDELGNDKLHWLGLYDESAQVFLKQGKKIENVISQIDELIENKFNSIYKTEQREVNNDKHD